MQLVSLLLSSLLVYFVRCDPKSVENSLVDNGKGESSFPLYWRSIIGDICQLPSIPRPATNPKQYIECVYKADNTGNRTDLGIWMSKECPDGYQFVAPARECKTIDSIKAQQQLCDGPDASKYEFCPLPKNGLRFMVKKFDQQVEQCECRKGEENCECPKVEVIELIPYNADVDDSNTSKVRQARQVFCQGQQGCNSGSNIPNGNCGCPNSTSSCICGSTYPSGVTQLPSQQIPAGCQLLSNGQLYCPQTPGQTTTPQPPAVIAPQPCPLVAGQGVQNAQYQGICSWMIDPLVADPQSPSHFLQCQPAPNSLYCGRWQRMPCEPGLIFNAQLQVCVWDPSAQPGTVPPATQIPGMIPPYGLTLNPMTPDPVDPRFGPSGQCGCGNGAQIGSCGTNNQCPGQSICQSATNEITGQGPCSMCCYYGQGAH